MHITKNNKICSIRGHKSKPCEHKHIIPLQFKGEKMAADADISWWDIDEYIEDETEETVRSKKDDFDAVL